MKAQELRIGNYYDHNGQIKTVTPNTILEVWEAERTWCKAIPITEEWLLRFGFVSNPYQDRYENKSIHVQCNKTRGVTELWIESMPHIKYVHQLQNLYFALTGEELIHDEWIVTKDNHPSIVDILKD
jgi:hypothetical protein